MGVFRGAAYGVAAPDGFSGTLNNSGRITASAPSGTAYSLYIGDGGEGGKGATTPTGVINNQVYGFLGGNLVIGSSVREVTNAGTIFIPSQLTATIIERMMWYAVMPCRMLWTAARSMLGGLDTLLVTTRNWPEVG